MLDSSIYKLIRYDINLLITLYLLLKNRQVSKTAKQLYIGQSAASHQLSKLRAMFADPLLVRTASGMVLTPFADSMLPRLEAVIADLDVLMAKPDASGTVRPLKEVYRVCVPEDSFIDDVSVLLYKYGKDLNIKNNVLFEVFTRHEQSVSCLNEGKIDFYFGNLNKVSPNILSKKLIELEYYFAVRQDHPLAERCVALPEIESYPWIDVLFREKIQILTKNLWGSSLDKMQCILKTPSANVAVALLNHSDALCVLPDIVINKNNLRKIYIQESLLKMDGYLY